MKKPIKARGALTTISCALVLSVACTAYNDGDTRSQSQAVYTDGGQSGPKLPDAERTSELTLQSIASEGITEDEYGTRRSLRSDSPLRLLSGDMPSDVLARVTSAYGDDPRYSPEPETSFREAKSFAASRLPDEFVVVRALLERVAFPFEDIGLAEGEDRTAVIEQRRAQLVGQQESARRYLAGVGAEIINTTWIVNSIRFRVRARDIDRINGIPGVVSFGVEDPKEQWVPERDGAEIRSVVLADSFHSAGYRGESGHNGTTNADILVGVHEAGTSFPYQHDCFCENATCSSSAYRIRERYDCTGSSCVTEGYPSSQTGYTHGLAVSWVLAGSIEENQDSDYQDSGGASYPGTANQIKRSGLAPEVSLRYYRGGQIEAWEQAVADNVDIINMSQGSDAQECQDKDELIYGDNDGRNEALKNVADTGTMVIKSVGNWQNPSPPPQVPVSCTADYPSWRPEVVAVGAITNASDYNGADLQLYSSRGKVNTNKASQAHPAVAMVAPDVFTYYAKGTSGYDNTENPLGGTSFATPVVSAAAAMLKQALYLSGGYSQAITDARWMTTNLFLLGNGWFTSSFASNSGAEAAQEVSVGSGYGKLRMHRPAELTAPYWWQTQKFTVGQSNSYQAWPAYDWDGDGDNDPIPSQVTQLKWAMAWFPSSLNDAGQMSAYMYTASCSSTNPVGSGTQIRADQTASFRKRLQAGGDLVAGQCVWFVVLPTDTPGSSTTFYSAHYFHSGSTGTH